MQHRVFVVFAWSHHPDWVVSQWFLDWSRCLVNLTEEEEESYVQWVEDASPGVWLTFYSTTVEEPTSATVFLSSYGGPQHAGRLDEGFRAPGPN